MDLSSLSTQALIFYGILSLVIALLITVFVFVVHSGLFTNITVKSGSPPIDAITIAYKFERGPYKNAGLLFNDVCSIAPTYKCLGVYYDDPRKVPDDKLRYIVGVVLPPEKDDTDDMATRHLLLSKGCKLFTFPSISHAVTTEFQLTTFLSMYIAIFRVYPKLSEYVQIHKLCAHPFIEYYDTVNGLEVMKFMAPLSCQDEFYLAETKTGSSSYGAGDVSVVAPTINDAEEEEGSLSESEKSDPETPSRITAATEPTPQDSSEASSFEEVVNVDN